MSKLSISVRRERTSWFTAVYFPPEQVVLRTTAPNAYVEMERTKHEACNKWWIVNFEYMVRCVNGTLVKMRRIEFSLTFPVAQAKELTNEYAQIAGPPLVQDS